MKYFLLSLVVNSFIMQESSAALIELCIETMFVCIMYNLYHSAIFWQMFLAKESGRMSISYRTLSCQSWPRACQ